MLLTLFIINIICFLPLISNKMNLLKNSLFSSSNRRKSRRSTQNQLKNYSFRQANNSYTDPLLYTFDNNDIELGTLDSDDESQQSNDNQHTIRTRTSRQNPTSAVHSGGSIIIVEKPILTNETIQAFAIRYRVPVSQLKRLNNIQNDQEFYALKHCRIPARPFGLLHETSPTIVDLNEQSTISLPVTHLSQQNHHAFLNAMDKDLELMRSKVEQLTEIPSTTLPIQMIKPIAKTSNELKCDGADCGCSLWHIIVIIILCILIPFVFSYFYIKSRHRKKL